MAPPAHTQDVIVSAAQVLGEGGLVAFPTETVYGLGADAANPAAVAKIYALKGRPSGHPVIVHVARAQSLDVWAIDIPAAARNLAAAFWPGPLTLILRKSRLVPAAVTGGQDTVGLRCPSHPMAQALLAEFSRIGSGAIAAPSANRFGHVSPTTAQHVRDEFGPELMVLDGGACEVGVESTIVDLSRGHPVLLRPGAITREQIATVTGEPPRSADAAVPRASGTLAAHYAPATRLVLAGAGDLDACVRDALSRKLRVAVFSLRAASVPGAAHWRVAPAGAAGYAHDLYAVLRELDASGADLIVVEAPPRDSGWEAVNDRLARAAAGFAEDEP